MTPRSQISPHLQRSVVTIESTIPPDMTIAEWNRLCASRRPAKPRRRLLARSGANKVVPLRPATADHYEPAQPLRHAA